MVQAAQLVLTMTRQHRGEVLAVSPRAMRRTFTMAEAAGLLPLAGLAELPLPQRFADLAARLDANRPRRAGSRADDILDPVRQPLAVHREVAEQIRLTLEPLAVAVLGRAGADADEMRPAA